MATVTYAHVELNEAGKPIISGTRMKVVMIAQDWLAGLDAEQIREQYPFLTLGQIHSALAYYYDHREELDRFIAEGDRLFEELRAAQKDSPLLQKLRDRGLIP